MVPEQVTDRRPMIAWLGVVALFVFAMVVVGGLTRLTDSGLSMVDWQPLMGVIPPLGLAEWQETFARYQQYPEYQKLYPDMTLDQFKGIFYWEYFHRLLGRLSGLVFTIPLLIFWWRGSLDPLLRRRLLIALVLGGLQGLLGWYMVKSGLVNEPRVSHYRLAAHLSLALFLLCWIFWLMLGVIGRRTGPRAEPLPAGFARVITGLIAVQIVYGAFVAGLHAGIGYNTFPTMNGRWIPAMMGQLDPAWLNLFENTVTVQFIHRGIAWLLLLVVGVFSFGMLRRRPDPAIRRAVLLLILAMAGQFLLGVWTLLAVVPVSLASLHQAGACVLLLASVYLNFLLSGTRAAD